MKKIYIINDHSVIKGGADAVAISQYNELQALGCDTVLFATVDGKLEGKDGELAEYPSQPSQLLKNLFWIKAYKKIKKLFTLDKSDVYIVHSWTKQLSSAVFYALRGKRVYIVAHDYFLVCPNGGLYNYKKKQKCSVKGGGAECLSINCDKSGYLIKCYRWLRFWVQTLGIKICNPRVIALNELQIRLFSHFPHVQLLKNKIDQNFHLYEINSSKRKYLTYIGRGDPEKGVSVLGDREIVSSLPIMVIGPDKGSLGPSFESAIYTGWLTEYDMAEYIDQALVGIFPSVWNEVDPLTPWKFFSRGIPVACCEANIFGQFLLNKIPELVYSNVHELNGLLERINDTVFYQVLCEKVYSLYISEVKVRSDVWSRGFNEIIN